MGLKNLDDVDFEALFEDFKIEAGDMGFSRTWFFRYLSRNNIKSWGLKTKVLNAYVNLGLLECTHDSFGTFNGKKVNVQYFKVSLLETRT